MSEAASKVKVAEASGYQPTAKEAEAARRMLERRTKQPPSPRFKVSYPSGKATIDPDHPDKAVTHALLAELFATGDGMLAEGLLVNLANVAQGEGDLTSPDLNVALAIVKAIGPRDPTEALLACQMAAIHKATIDTARRFNRSETLPQADFAGTQLNKLARTFAAQLEALKRYRSTGEQSIRVQHVTVNEGGQAIVGNVKTGGGGNPKNQSQSHAVGANEAASPSDASSPALLSHQQALAMPLPSPGCEGQERVPHARSEGGSAKGQG
jgi:hypothetical protein